MEWLVDAAINVALAALAIGAAWYFFKPTVIVREDDDHVPCLLCHAKVPEHLAMRLRSGKGYVCASHRRTA